MSPARRVGANLKLRINCPGRHSGPFARHFVAAQVEDQHFRIVTVCERQDLFAAHPCTVAFAEPDAGHRDVAARQFAVWDSYARNLLAGVRNRLIEFRRGRFRPTIWRQDGPSNQEREGGASGRDNSIDLHRLSRFSM